jgi:transposase
MSTTKREPLLKDLGIMGRMAVRDFYETARAKDAELIQKLVDALALIGTDIDEMSGNVCEAIGHNKDMQHEGYEHCPGIRKLNAAIAAAKAAGFTPSEP